MGSDSQTESEKNKHFLHEDHTHQCIYNTEQCMHTETHDIQYMHALSLIYTHVHMGPRLLSPVTDDNILKGKCILLLNIQNNPYKTAK